MNRIMMLLAAAMPFSCSSDFKTLGVEDFASAIGHKEVQLVDVRTPEEYSHRRIPNSMNIDIYNADFIDSAAVRLDKGKPVAVYCRSGKRSTAAANALVKAGFKEVLNLQGGIYSWMTAGKVVSDNADYIVFDGEKAPDFEAELFDPDKKYADGYKGSIRQASGKEVARQASGREGARQVEGKEGEAETGNGQSRHGEKFSLSEMKGKVVMLQFTASWCGVCRAEMPQIESDIWQKHKDNPNFVLLAIDRDEDASKILQAIKATGVTYPLAFDPDAEIFDKYALHDSGITRNVLIDRNGNIVMRTRLYNKEEFAALVAKIDEMLAE